MFKSKARSLLAAMSGSILIVAGLPFENRAYGVDVTFSTPMTFAEQYPHISFPTIQPEFSASFPASTSFQIYGDSGAYEIDMDTNYGIAYGFTNYNPSVSFGQQTLYLNLHALSTEPTQPSGEVLYTGFSLFMQADTTLSGYSYNPVTPVPEPSSFVLAGCGFAAFFGIAMRARRKRSA